METRNSSTHENSGERRKRIAFTPLNYTWGKKAKPSQISVSFWWSLKGWGWCSCNYFCQSTGWRPGYLPPAWLGAAHPHAGIKYESHINYKPTKHSFGGCGNFFSPLFQVPMFFSKKFGGKSAPQDLALVQRGRHLIPSPLFWQKTAQPLSLASQLCLFLVPSQVTSTFHLLLPV